MFARILMVLPVFAALSACVFSEDVADVQYIPANAAPISNGAPVTLNVADGRTANRTRISVKINGYNMDAAPIRSSRPVTDIVRDALTLEFRNRGFRLVPGARAVDVTIQTFYNTYGTGVFGGHETGDVTITTAVMDGPRILYRQTYNGQSSSVVLLVNGSNAAASVAEALQDAISQLFTDAGLVSALTRPAD